MLLASSPSGQSAYQSNLIAVCAGLIYIGSPAPFNNFTLAGGQGGGALLNTSIKTLSATYMNQHVYIVDGQNIVDLNMLTGTAAYLQIDTGSTAIATIGTTGTVSAVNILNRGTSYTAAPTVVFTGGGGSGAAATVTESGGTLAASVTITNHGTGYTSAPFVSFTGGGMIDAPAPLGATGIVNWRNRLIYWGQQSNPQNLYASRAGDAYDYNYGATDSAAAFVDDPATSGRIGEPIITVIPYTDDYCMICCSHSMSMYQGDPAAGGTNTQVSQDMGVVGIEAWTIAPDGQLYFVATGGLFSVKPIWEFYRPPENLTKESYNQFFQNINAGTEKVSLEWDADYHYLHVYRTPLDGQTVGTSILWDDRKKGLWPDEYPLNFGPNCTTLYLNVNQPNDRAILLGGQDGYVRQESQNGVVLDDDGTAISASITLGPISPFEDAASLISTTFDLGELNPEIVYTPVTDELVSGVVDGINNVFTLTAIATNVQVFFNGVQQDTTYYTFANVLNPSTGNTVTQMSTFTAGMVEAPPPAGVAVTVNFTANNVESNWNGFATLNSGPDAYSVTEGTPHSFFVVDMLLDRRQQTFRQRLRGNWFTAEISNDTDGQYFSFESLELEFNSVGTRRGIR